MTQVWAVFPDEQAARRTAGRWPDVELFAAEPTEALLGIPAHVQTRMGWAAVAGGLLGGLAGGALAAGASAWMGLDVGGMPRLPLAPIGIVTFAIAALGATAATLLVLLVQGRIFGLKLDVPQETRRRLAQGAVAALVRTVPEERESVVQELERDGAEVTVVEVQ